MKIERHETGPRMSKAVVHGDTVYLAGIVADAPKGKSTAEQTKNILSQIDGFLARAGTDKSKVLSANIWITDMANFAEMNGVWDAWLSPGNAPARATVEAKLASPDYKVEIMVVAARYGQRAISARTCARNVSITVKPCGVSTCQKVQPLQASSPCARAPMRWIEPTASPSAIAPSARTSARCRFLASTSLMPGATKPRSISAENGTRGASRAVIKVASAGSGSGSMAAMRCSAAAA